LTANFSEIENLTGNANDDFFTFQNGGSVSGLIDGAGEENRDQFVLANTSTETIRIGLSINADINANNIEHITGNIVSQLSIEGEYRKD
jgi:hypothetical protein